MSVQKKVKVIFDGNTKLMKFELTESLSHVREKLGNTIFDYIFVDGDDEVDDEENFTIEDIIQNGILYMKPKPKQIIKHTPIEGSEFLCDKGNLKIYLYPSIKFSALEESQSFSMMVVGETGSGKLHY